MLNRREVLGVAASAVLAGGRASIQAAQPWQFTLRVVGSAAFAKSTDDGYDLWLPSHMHDASFLVDARLLKNVASWQPIGKNVELRTYHKGLSDGREYYRVLPVKDLAVEGASGNASDQTKTLARLKDVVEGFGKCPTLLPPEKLREFTQARIKLRNGTLVDGPPTGVSLGCGLEWDFHKRWTKNPTSVLSDCVDFVANVTSSPQLPDLKEGEPITVWLINHANEEGSKNPKKLEHGRVYWTFYADKAVTDLPAAEVDAAFPKEETLGTPKSLRSDWPEQQTTEGVRILQVPYVELCYGAALDF